MTTTRASRSALVGVALAILPAQVRGQRDVQGATLGVTTVRQLIETRGMPADTGRNVSGWLFVAFGQEPRYIYYFSPEDSVVEWARVFVIDGYTASRVHEAFGRPDTLMFGEDLSKQESFKRGAILASYKPNGDVGYIEYHPDVRNSIGFRRARRADARQDTLMANAIALNSGELGQAQALDTVKVLRAAHIKLLFQKSRNKPATVRARIEAAQSARWDSLCVQVACDGIRRSGRVYDTDP